jgi:hypothetical protein
MLSRPWWAPDWAHKPSNYNNVGAVELDGALRGGSVGDLLQVGMRRRGVEAG